jgi:pantoate kinase
MEGQAFIRNKINDLLFSNETMDSIGVGYAPAHITSIFEIFNSDPNPLKCGSRGIGFCINKGVSTFILTKKDTKQDIQVIFNDKEIAGETTISTIKNLIGELNVKIKVFSYTELPQSQGFGLSGAGALSSAIALNSALKLKLDYPELVNAAHSAEIINQTGLGDVVAQATGGVVLREHHGAIKFGKIKNIKIRPQLKELVICILGHELSTSKIITDKRFISSINMGAKKYLGELQNMLTNNTISFKELTKLSFEFVKESELLGNKVLKLIKRIQVESAGFASMIMLGNAIFSVGNTKKIQTICQELGHTFVCNIDLLPAICIEKTK